MDSVSVKKAIVIIYSDPDDENADIEQQILESEILSDNCFILLSESVYSISISRTISSCTSL